MKSMTTISIFLLGMLFGIRPASAQVYNGSVSLYTQADVNAFGANNYTSITGGLRLQGAGITDISPLSSLQTIGADLFIISTGLTNINALSQITSVSSNLFITSNSSLQNLNGLTSLTHVSGDLYLKGNSALADISGLSSLASVDGQVWLSAAAVSDLSGLEALTSIGRGLIIEQMPNLVNIDALSSLTSLGATNGESIRIERNTSLQNIDGLAGITSVSGLVWITDNPALQNIDGLGSVTQIGGEVDISNNASLLDIDGLASVASIGSGTRRVNITSNASLQNIDGLGLLTSIGRFTISGNPNLTNVDGLASVVSFTNRLAIISNANLQNLDGLASATSVASNLLVAGNANLSDCCGIYYLVNTPGAVVGEINISGNQTGCESQPAIISACQDSDNDGVPDATDNCPTTANADQANNDGDAQGDVCDTDDDNDGVLDVNDNCPFVANDDQKDLDNDGTGDVCDLTTDICGALDALIAQIQASSISDGLKNSLTTKLTNAKSSYQNNNENAAIGQLGAFKYQVNAQWGNGIPANLAKQWRDIAQAIIDAINGGADNCGGPKPGGGGKNDPTVGVLDYLGLEVFPNPAARTVNIRLHGLEGAAVLTIYNQLGSAVWQQPVESGELELNVSLSDNAFAPGIYFVNLRSEKEVITQRLVVAK